MADLEFERHMRAADALMWTIERDPVLRSTITAVSVLDRPPDWEALRASVARAVAVVPRLHQRVVEPPIGPPQWVDVADVDLAYHLRRVAAPDPPTFRTVLDMAAVDAMAGFDRARPLWEFTVVEGLGGGQAAFVQKIHHALTDGIGAMRLAGELFDAERAPLPRGGTPSIAGASGGWMAVARRGWVDAASGVSRALTGTVPGLANAAREFMLHPATVAGETTALVRSAGKLLAPVTEPLSPIMRQRSLSWHFDAFDVDLEALKRAAGESSLNDAFLAAAAGGLHRYHLRHGHDVEQLRMTMPVSIRAESDPLGGNRFVPVRFPLPVGIPDPAERMRALGRVARQWRDEPATALTDTLAAALNRLPAAAVTALFGGMLKNIDFLCTNVPGFPAVVYIGGAGVVRQYAFAPPSGAAVNVALLSHAGTCCITVNCDVAAVPDPSALTECLVEGFDEVLSLGAHATREAS